MNWNSYPNLEGMHAFLSASKFHWIRYDDDKLIETFTKAMAARRGTEIHAFAAEAIRLGIKLPKSNQTLNMYVNDALGFRMDPEKMLVYSENAFGTADTISFRKERGKTKNLLRIHDLKTGVTPSSINQLEVYAAFFCLEYGHKPHDIEIELRVYQNDECMIYEPDPEDILRIMDKTQTFDRLITNARMEALT